MRCFSISLLLCVFVILVFAACNSDSQKTEMKGKQMESEPVREVESVFEDTSEIQESKPTAVISEGLSQQKKDRIFDIPGRYVVISFNGINMRAEPNQSAPVIKRIAYREPITMLERKSYGFMKYRDVKFDRGKYSIDGHWVKVKYEDLEGYVFNAFIYAYGTGEDRELRANAYNSDFGLLYPGGFCSPNIPFDPSINWYGVYKDGDEYELRPTKIGMYHTTLKEDDGRDIYYNTEDNKNLVFVFGSKEKNERRVISGSYNSEGLTVNKFFPYKLNQDGSLDKRALKILDESPPESYKDIIVNWKGDLDNDGKPDYIISSSCCGEYVRTYLYLSSQMNDDIMKPVAVFGSGYCC